MSNTRITVVRDTRVVVVNRGLQTQVNRVNVLRAVPTGPQGPAGTDGTGIPLGGTNTQVLAKVSDEDLDIDWVDAGTPAAHGSTHESGGGDEITLAQSQVTNLESDLANKYAVGGTDVALADGGTGASLADPNADRVLFWDDSAATMTWLTMGTNLTITGTTLDATGGGGSALTVKEDDVTVDATVTVIDFGNGFDVAESPEDEVQVSLDLGEYTGTDLPVASGGTGASTASGARTNLDAVSQTDFNTLNTIVSDVIVSKTTTASTELWLGEGTNNGVSYAVLSAPDSMAAQRNIVLPDASTTLVGTDVTQTLTNKTIDLTSNTLVGSVSEFNAALESADFYTSGGTDVAVADGGTGASDASGARTNLGVVPGTDVQTQDAFLQDIADLTDPGADRILFWDDSAGEITWLTVGTNLSVSTTTLNASGGGSGLADGDYGDVTVSGSSTVLSVDPGATHLKRFSVRVATVSNVALSTAVENGDTIDGVTLATGDLVLIHEQSTASEDGVYTVNASGAPTRHADMDASGDLVRGTQVFVREGTFYAGYTFVCTNTGATPWVPGTSSSTWTSLLTQATGDNLYQPLDSDLTDLAVRWTAASASGAASLDFREDTDNGTNRVRLQGPASTADVTVTLPDSTDTLVGRDTTDTLTNKTLTSPTLTTPVLGTPSSGTLTNCSGLPLSGVTDSTSEALGVGTLELGHASDTTLSRSSAGVLAVEGVVVPTISSSNTLTNKTIDVTDNVIANFPVLIGVALSDETTAITTGTAKVTIRAPYAFTLTAVRASLTTASSSGTPTVDINESGTTVLSTKLSIDANEKTSTTAASAAVISDSSIADDAEITFDIDTAGTGATGLKVWLIGTRSI